MTHVTQGKLATDCGNNLRDGSVLLMKKGQQIWAQNYASSATLPPMGTSVDCNSQSASEIFLRAIIKRVGGSCQLRRGGSTHACHNDPLWHSPMT